MFPCTFDPVSWYVCFLYLYVPLYNLRPVILYFFKFVLEVI